MNKQNKWEDLSRKMHEWYLEATKELNPESYNAKAQKSYDDLTEEQKQIDRYIANKVIQLLSSQLEEVEKGIKDYRKRIIKDFGSSDPSMPAIDDIIEIIKRHK